MSEYKPYLDDAPAGSAAEEMLDHFSLNAKRKGKNQAEQNRLGPLEHRAWAREFSEEHGIPGAISAAVATQIYSLAKDLGLTNSRSKSSMEENKQAFDGIREGLLRRK